jgi:cytochrome b involved in lipid metabolism
MKPMLEWINQSKITKRMYFFYEDRVLDLTEFMNIHPGGQKALKNYVSKDITDILFSVYPHSTQSTLQVLFRYQIGKIPEKDFNHKIRNEKSPLKNSHGHESQGKEKKKVGFNKKFVYTEG